MAFRVSIEKSGVILMDFPIYVACGALLFSSLLLCILNALTVIFFCMFLFRLIYLVFCVCLVSVDVSLTWASFHLSSCLRSGLCH